MYVQDIIKNVYENIPHKHKKFYRAMHMKLAHLYEMGFIYDMNVSKFIDIMDALGYDVQVQVKKGNRFPYKNHDLDGPIKVETIVEKEVIEPPKKVHKKYAMSALELREIFNDRYFNRYVANLIETYKSNEDEEEEEE